VSVITEEKNAAVDTLVQENRRIIVRELSMAVNIGMGSLHQILHAHLGYCNVRAQWVPKHLTDEQKYLQMGICMEVLCRYQTDGEGFLEQVVTVDETWCHHFDPATKRMSQEWRHPGTPRPKNARSSATAGKVMLTVFVDIHGVDADRCNDQCPTLL
jgi:hypothetical protein